MRFVKRRLAEAEQGYSINAMTILGKERVVAAPEGNGPAIAFDPADGSSFVIAPEPGGCMGFAPVPGRDDAVVMITEFYPIFKAEGAGLHLFQADKDGTWTGSKIMGMPFVHRITSVSNGAESYLVGATVCGGKDFQDDWSRPGKVYVSQFGDTLEGPWDMIPVLEGIHRNHGMGTGTHRGKQCVFISGDEGIFAITVPAPGEGKWPVEKIFDKPVSELAFADLDDDGEDELAVIEPFHGETMAVYKKRGEVWEPIFQAGLAFGHGLWAGSLAGDPAVIVGNRSDDKNLVCYRVTSSDPFEMEEIVIDHASGTTNLDVIQTATGQAVVAVNAEHVEYAIYAVEE